MLNSWGLHHMNRIFTSVLVASCITSFTVAQAAVVVAELGAFEGKVLVNHGKGFVPATGALGLNVGDQLLVGEKSSAVVTYNTGCKVSASAGQVLTVSAKAPCKAGEKVAMVGSEMIAPAADPVGAGAMAGGGLFGGGSVLPLVLVGGGIAATVGIILATRPKASP